MDLMNLGSGRGIAGEYRFKTIEDVLSMVPWYRQHSYCDGTITNYLSVVAILPGGEEIELETATHFSDGNEYIADTETAADTIGVQIAALPVYPVALVFTRREADANGGEEEWSEYLPLTPPNWTKIRRRVEDALRKTSNKEVLFRFAQILKVRL